jgi:hypothetical protein
MFPSADKITDDITCIACGYLLKGIANRGRCPECGTPIRSSTRPSRMYPYHAGRIEPALWFVVVNGSAVALIMLALGAALDQRVVLQFSARIAQATVLIAILGAPFSRELRQSRIALVAFAAALATALVAPRVF